MANKKCHSVDRHFAFVLYCCKSFFFLSLAEIVLRHYKFLNTESANNEDSSIHSECDNTVILGRNYNRKYTHFQNLKDTCITNSQFYIHL